MSLSPSSFRTVAFAFGLFAFLALPAKAEMPAQTAQMQASDISDPFEYVNRGVFEFNRFLDEIALKPLAAWYGLLPIVIRMLAGLAAKVPSLFKLLIPDSIRTSAKLDAEAYDPNDPTMTAAIAARRQADPRYNAAYTVFNQKHKAAK